MTETINVEALVDNSTAAPSVTPEETATSQTADLTGLSLAELNATLNKNFTTKEAALKSIKDTMSYVGMKEEQVEEKLKAKGYLSRADLDTELFYRDNPEYAQHKAVIDSFAQINGISAPEAAKSDALSALLAKAKKADSYEETTSVIETNPRLVATKSNLDKAREIQFDPNQSENRDTLVAKAVLDAFEG